MAKKNITQATYLTNNVQNLPDLVEEQASLVKQTFDKVGLDGKTYVNETLITELESVTLNDSGAHRIGLNVANVTADNAADGIAEVKADIQGVVVGTIPDNTLTEAKMAADMKKQSGGVYPFDSGTDLETDVAANLVKLDIARTAVTDTGIADAYVVDTAGTFDLTLDGNILTFIPSNTNTSTSQIVIDGQTAKAIKKADDTGTLIDLEEGDLLKNRPSQLAWSVGSDFFTLRPSGGSNIKSIQRGNVTISFSNLTQSVTISEVDTTKSIIILSYTSTSSPPNYGSIKPRAYFATGTSFTLERGNASHSGLVVSWQVIEFKDIKSLQSGQTTAATSSTGTQAISSVDLSKSALFFSFSYVSGGSGTMWEPRMYLSSTTEITYEPGFSITNNVVYSWFVVEFK